AIEQQLGKFIGYTVQACVTLRAVESRRVCLLGRFQPPGVYAMPATVTLLEAIGRAGGPLNISGGRDLGFGYTTEDVADLKRSFVIRQGQLLPVDFDRLYKQGDLSQNIYLQPDDFVYMPAAGAKNVYVLGAVVQPRAV